MADSPQIVVKASAVIAVVAILLAVFAAVAYGIERRKRLEEEKAAEAKTLQAAGLLVSAQEGSAALQQKVSALEVNSQVLQDALTDAQARAGKTTLVEVQKITTKTVVIPGPEVPDVRPCLLAPGDSAQIRVSEIKLQTSLGNEVVTGTASAWRMQPSERKLFESAFEATASSVSRNQAAVAVEPPGWGFGVAAMYSKGFTVGPAVSPPVVEVLGFKIEASASVGFGNGISGALNALVRR